MIKTGYYRGKGISSENNLISISFSIKDHVYDTIDRDKLKHYKKLAPSLLLHNAHQNNEINDEQYTKIYNDYLATLNPHIVMKEILELGGENAILLCYENADSFCHRQLVTKWLNDNGYFIEEYKYVIKSTNTFIEEFGEV